MALEPTLVLHPAASPVAVSDGELAMQAPVARSDSRASGRSTVSLTRRPATRTRSRTLTSAPRAQQPTSSRPATADADAPPMPSSPQPMYQPNRPPRSPMRVATMPSHAEFPQTQSQAQQIAAQETQKQRASEELDDPRIGRAGRDDREVWPTMFCVRWPPSDSHYRLVQGSKALLECAARVQVLHTVL